MHLTKVFLFFSSEMNSDHLTVKQELQDVEQQLSEVSNQIEILLNKQSSLQEKRRYLKKHLQGIAERQNASHDWSSEEFSWSKQLRQTCQSVFAIEDFRPNQLEAMNTTLSGLDCVLILPTGAGKSLCYQLPAVLSSGITLVISPLVSLMEDQVMNLEKLNISAVMLNAATPKEVHSSVLADMVKKPCKLKLLYVTPEKLAKSKRFMNKLEACYKAGLLSRIAIDEVHCCSQWGHDFRPDYKFLGILKKQFPNTPILGLTATASTQVLVDVQKILQIPHAQVYKGSFNRPNLHYSVREKPASHEDCVDSISKLIKAKYSGQSGIIYCFSRKDTVTLTSDLNARGVKSACYHADMEADQRSRIHNLWLSNSVQVIVATIAFGMGIDKPDVRFVIHHSLSKSIENYYQESGRAGRDGAPADCVLYYRLADVFRQSCMVFTEATGLEKLYNIVSYCVNLSSQCRRQLLAGHFSEVWSDDSCNSMCDRCYSDSTNQTSNQKDFSTSAEVQLVYEILDKASAKDVRLTSQKVLEAMTGKGAVQNRGDVSCKLSRTECEYLIATMLLEGSVREDFHFTPYSTISYLVVGNRKSTTSHESPAKTSKRASDSISGGARNKSSKNKKPKAAVSDKVIVLD